MNRGLTSILRGVTSINRASINSGVISRNLATQSNKLKTGTAVGFNRLQDYYYNVLQEDVMLLKFQYPGDDYVLEPPVVKRRPKFSGPNLDDNGQVIKKKGSIRPRKPTDIPVGPFNVPELEKIQIQLMMKEAISSKYALLSGYLLLESITGEKATTLESRSNVAGWKLRKGQPVGCEVTLTGGAMYAFLDKLVEVVLPRIKEYSGLRVTAGDGTGNMALGFPASTVGLFPDLEVIYDMLPIVSGFNIVFNTSSYRNPNARLLMSGLQLPFVPKPRN